MKTEFCNLLARGWTRVVLGAIAFGFTAQALTAEIPFRDAELFYEFDGEPLQSFFEGFFAEQGLAVSLSLGVRNQSGTLNGPRRGSPGELFDSIAASNQILAYYDGTVVFLYKPQEQASRYITAGRERATQFRRLYRDLGLGNAQNTAKVSTAQGVVAVNGAPRFVDQVVQLIEAISIEQSVVATPTSTLRYFPLRYAFASDTTIYVGRKQTVVPGVASLLNQAVTGQGSMGIATPQAQPARRSNRLRGQGLAATRPNQYLPPAQPYAGQVVEQAPSYAFAAAAPPADPDGPYIIADPMHNSILVRDKPERMAMYQSLIEILDIEPQLIEIVATVIDIDKQRLKRLGVDFRVRGTDVGVNFGDPESAQNLINADNLDNVDLISALTGLTTGVVVGNTVSFAARLNALDDRDIVSVVSSPQVVTLNDMEAVIESNREVFIPVGGTYEVDLFDVIAGTILRVTPHVIDDGGTRRIRITASIEDGDVQLVSSAVQRVELPIVDRNAVTTQAIIDAGQSLLVGGLRRTTDAKVKNTVPLLGKIPIVKHLFTNSQTQRDATDRLFLITPRLVSRERVVELDQEARRVWAEVELELDKL